MFRVTMLRAIFLAWLAVYFSACSSFVTDQRAEYEKATTLPALEIPPDLATPATDEEMGIPNPRPRDPTRYSDYATGTAEQRETLAATANAVLPMQDEIKIVREGNKRWLVVRNTPDQIWLKVRNFWLDQGFPIKMEDPKTGILETEWLENRVNIPQSGIRALFGKVMDRLYDSSTRDRFRMRLERGETPENTEIYISHLGAEEVARGDSTVWQTRPNDPELEAVMLQRLMVFLGVKEEKAKTMLAVKENNEERARLITEEGNISLILAEDFPRAWRHTGLALDQVGFTVEDRDRSRGIYYVRYNDPLVSSVKPKKGFFSKLAFWRSDKILPSTEQYRIYLQERGEQTLIMVQNKDGSPDISPTGQRILTLLHEKLR